MEDNSLGFLVAQSVRRCAPYLRNGISHLQPALMGQTPGGDLRRGVEGRRRLADDNQGMSGIPAFLLWRGVYFGSAGDIEGEPGEEVSRPGCR